MADSLGMPAQLLGRILYKNDASGAAQTIADGDDNVFFFPGSESMTSSYAAVFRTIAAVSKACFNSPAKQQLTGATGTIGGCPLGGYQTFLSQFVNGLAAGYDDVGAIASLDIESPSDSNCLDCDNTATVTQDWSMVELVCYRDVNNVVTEIKANVARAITAADPSAGQSYGGLDPTANTISYNLTFATNDGWGTGPGGLFEIYEDTGQVQANRRPVSQGITLPSTEYDEIIAACAADLSYAGIPLTAAMVVAETVPDMALFTGGPTPA